ALNSGTSALQLALILAGVGENDHVLIGTHTFAACANAVIYQRAEPVFIDSEPYSWNLNPDLLRRYLESAQIIPKAVIITHIYGIPSKVKETVAIAKQYGIKVIEDAAESLGSTVENRVTGTIGDYGVVSFNGNKIVTTGGGGALICSEEDREKGLFLSTQANKGKYEYDHPEVGFNFRMSNVLAGMGIAQFKRLDEFVEAKRAVFDRYQLELSDYISFYEEQSNTFCNRWLSVGLVKDSTIGLEAVIEYLDSKGIECRKFWKPLHLHSAYTDYSSALNGLSFKLFEKGICLPSGSGMTEEEQDFVIDNVRKFFSTF
ncbi:MAG: DegT/DnrJ/EryC1/StrS family aminotransferase, partial [Ekhidna sp.]|nr:DegT/DnrJ/EryC1/StrS family aminotransferase [Ekhidna sp.]